MNKDKTKDKEKDEKNKDTSDTKEIKSNNNALKQRVFKKTMSKLNYKFILEK